MRTKLLAALLLVCLGSLLAVGHVVAQTPYTSSSLRALLLGESDITTALGAVHSGESVTNSTDLDPVPGASAANAGRLFFTTNNIIGINLYTTADGSLITVAQLSDVLGDQRIRGAALALVDSGSFSNFALGGAAGIGDADQTASFSGAIGGVTANVVADFFVQGNIYGYVFYASQGNTDATVVGAVAQLQVMNLP